MSVIGTAGWAIPARYGNIFPREGSHLARYATLLKGVEINSSFYRSHKRVTYERWANTVPPDFRFSVKLPRAITHDRRLDNYGDLLERFLEQVSGLDGKLSVLLVQLPPSLVYNAPIMENFFHDLSRGRALMACEPRHISWFTPQADRALKELAVSRVSADPARAPGDGVPGGETRMAYFRLHGSPRIYYSDYSDESLCGMASKLRDGDWCIFDNTAAFHALGNALALTRLAADK